MYKIRGERNKYKSAFMVVLIAVLLSSCIFIGTVLAWLTQDITRTNENVLNIGSVDFEIYNGAVKISSTKSNHEGVVTGTSQEVSITASSEHISNIENIKIRNTGTINAIIRVTLSIYTKDENNNKVPMIIKSSPSSSNEINIQNDGWINDFDDDVSSGYVYYNGQIEPYYVRTSAPKDGSEVTQELTARAVPVVRMMQIPDSMVGETYYITLTVEGVAYKGNIYQELSEGANGSIPADGVDAYPFGLPSTLPSAWTAWE